MIIPDSDGEPIGVFQEAWSDAARAASAIARRTKGPKTVKFDRRRKEAYQTASRLGHSFSRDGRSGFKKARQQAGNMVAMARRMAIRGWQPANYVGGGAFGRGYKTYNSWKKKGRGGNVRFATINPSQTIFSSEGRSRGSVRRVRYS